MRLLELLLYYTIKVSKTIDFFAFPTAKAGHKQAIPLSTN